MARYTGAACKVVRRYQKQLDGFKVRDLATKCNVETLPGQHGQARKKKTNFGQQLNEKQALRFKYLMLEKPFKNMYKKAASRKGATGVLLLQMLESRLDNVVYRMGFACTRKEARQIVNHKAILVNGSPLNIASYQVQPGDIVSVKERARENQTRISDALKLAEGRGWADWLTVDTKQMSGEYKRVPDQDELPTEIDVQLVVELYSK